MSEDSSRHTKLEAVDPLLLEVKLLRYENKRLREGLNRIASTFMSASEISKQIIEGLLRKCTKCGLGEGVCKCPENQEES